MNLDDANDHRELNTQVDDYIVAEFVAVPENFDLDAHLSMREQVGIFAVNQIDTKQVHIISQGVVNSAVFSTMNNALLSPQSCMFYLLLLGELGLILKKVDNPLRRLNYSYEDFIKHWENERYNFVRGQQVLRINFLIVNIVPLLQQDVIDEAVKAANDIIKYQEEINQFNGSVTNLDRRLL